MTKITIVAVSKISESNTNGTDVESIIIRSYIPVVIGVVFYSDSLW